MAVERPTPPVEGYVFGRYEVAMMAERIAREFIRVAPQTALAHDFPKKVVEITRAIIAEVEQSQPPRE